MDEGNFVMEMNGVRWAVDLGGENYNEVEKRGLNLWNSAQDSDRWTIFRIGSFSHNILTVNGEQQRVKGHAKILRSTGAPNHQTVLNLTEIYQGQLAAAQRSVSMKENKVTFTDEIKTLDQPTHIRWAMLTHAKVKLSEGNQAILTQAGQILHVSLSGLPKATWQVKDISHPPRDWENKNKNTRMLYFEADLAPEKSFSFEVKMQGTPAWTP